MIIGFQDTVENVGDVFLGHSVIQLHVFINLFGASFRLLLLMQCRTQWLRACKVKSIATITMELRTIAMRNALAKIEEQMLQYYKCTKHQFIHLLTATCNEWHTENSKNHKKGDITHHHIVQLSMCCWIISPFYDFAIFDVSLIAYRR